MNLRPSLPALRCAVLAGVAAVAIAIQAHAAPRQPQKAGKRPVAPALVQDGRAEARLLEVYRLVGQGQMRQALSAAGSLVHQHPNFQLAQLVYGDLLAAQTRPVRTLGDVPEASGAAGQALAELREESQLRLKALRELPPAGTVPEQFLQLSPRTRHAIAVDTSRARLYLFENTTAGLKLLAHYYISVGKSGIDKAVEGDLRTPLGVYYITSNLDPKSLRDFYGAGALPLNYPNAYDVRRGKTGSGIWLHGTPPAQFSRAPKATDGCVVLANPDLQRLLRTVEVRTTPVVIAPALRWVAQPALQADRRSFGEALASWRAARSGGDVGRLLAHYMPDASAGGKSLADWVEQARVDVARGRGRELQLKDVSFLRWTDSAETMVVTFGEVRAGQRTGPVKRQYWIRRSGQWKIFYEGVIG